MKVALYIRVSTLQQYEKGHSVDEQKRRLKAYCDSQGWTKTKYFIDGGHSGSNMDRPALQELIKQIDNFDMVLVYKLDRLSRNQRDILYLIEDVFLANNVEFNSITESFDTSTPVGRMVLSMMGAFAELERQQINERMMMGRIASAHKGRWRGGSGVPTGYTYLPMTKGGDGNLKINEYDAQIIHKIYDLFELGYTYNAIIEYCAENYGKNFSGAHGVKRILTNPTYIGKIRYCGEVYQGHHEPIISEEQFNRVQKLVEKHDQETTYDCRVPRHLLTGLLRCSCGARVCYRGRFATNAKGERVSYHYYECYSKNQRKGMATQKGCKNKIWKAEELEEVVWDILDDLQYEDLQPTSDNSKQEIKVLQSELKKVEKQIGKLIALYSNDNIPIDALNSQINDLNRQKTKLSDRITTLEQKSLKKPISDVKKEIKKLDVVRNADLTTQRAFLQSLIKQITLMPNHELKFEWKF